MKRALVIDPDTRRELGLVGLVHDETLKALSNPLRVKMMKILSLKPMYVRELAEELGLNEQTAYYHVNELRRAGLLTEVEIVRKKGASARRLAAAVEGVAVLFKKETRIILTGLPSFFEELFSTGHVVMVLSNPTPHGPYRGRGVDHYLAAQLAFNLGSYYGDRGRLTVKLDTEITREDWRENLIVVGGPMVNMVTARLNPTLPIHFNTRKGNIVVSKLSGNAYYEDETGVVELVKNPFNPRRYVLVLAGKRHVGTRAAFAALARRREELSAPNTYDNSIVAHVVEGVDSDGDGVIDDAEVLE